MVIFIRPPKSNVFLISFKSFDFSFLLTRHKQKKKDKDFHFLFATVISSLCVMIRVGRFFLSSCETRPLVVHKTHILVRQPREPNYTRSPIYFTQHHNESACESLMPVWPSQRRREKTFRSKTYAQEYTTIKRSFFFLSFPKVRPAPLLFRGHSINIRKEI